MARRDSIMTKPNDSRGTFRRLLQSLGPFRAMIFLVVLLSVLSNFLSLLGPSLAGSAINEVAAGKGQVRFDRVYAYALRMLLCYVSASVLSLVISITMVRISKKFASRMRQQVFEKLMRLPVGYFDRNQAGDIISRVSYDIDVISTCMATDIVSILTSIVTVIGSLFMMVSISLPLSAVALITVPASILYTTHMRRITQPRFVRRSKKYGAMNGFVEEMLSGQKTILAYAHEDAVDERFDAINQDAAQAYYDADSIGSTIGPTMGFINNICLSLIAFFGSILYLHRLISIGSISSFVLYSRKFSGPINEVANIINELFSALAAAERVFSLLDEEEEPADPPTALSPDRFLGEVQMRNVVFGYTPEQTIIHNLSLDAPAGRLIAIVGPTGAGKTTIINLLMRFYDVRAGEIRVDGQDIRALTRHSLRSAYEMVLQDTWVFRGTIFENIAYGKENASLEEVVRAAKAAHIHPFIMRLPEGYETVISEDGGNISKGQKQLLTIARAMLSSHYDNSNMLILDEATSNVDTSTERAIQIAMRDLMQDKTCFVIAHRLSTIQSADLILVLNHGDVVEQGTHASLMAARGFYYNLYRAQFE
ncbi:MAG: ABC transporter ATP-binding protein [Clostridia bacterium]|nr:ABC transporter ATP-binding protein [Clostridia bacterium]